MIFLRSTLCNLLMLAWTILCGVGGVPVIFMNPPKSAVAVMNFWGRGMLAIARICCGIRMEVQGEIPAGKVIIASKHQSAWETIVYHLLLPNPVFVLKRELNYIPIVGWYAMGLESIAIDRKAGKRALVQVVDQSIKKLEQARQVIIFPEGTRVKPGERRKYHGGVGAIYARAGVSAVPVALDSGVCWPKNSWKKYPGIITICFLEPIPPGLPREEFMRVVEERIEAGQAALMKN